MIPRWLKQHRLAAGAAALVVAGVVASVVLLTSEALEKACNLADGRSGVAFELAGAELERGDSVVLCVNHRCRRHRWRTGVGSELFISTRAAGPRRVGVVVVLERRGERAEVTSGRVRLERSEPNGPGCGTWVEHEHRSRRGWNTSTAVAELRPSAAIG